MKIRWKTQNQKKFFFLAFLPETFFFEKKKVYLNFKHETRPRLGALSIQLTDIQKKNRREEIVLCLLVDGSKTLTKKFSIHLCYSNWWIYFLKYEWAGIWEIIPQLSSMISPLRESRNILSLSRVCDISL